MAGLIHHRGPDKTDFYEDPDVCLGHCRLSIVDVDAGHQPMASEGRDLWVVYNGEIFNHMELRRDLERCGHRYQTHCDTETVLNAYQEYGPECVEKFRGMFAFTIWDQKRRQLFCARDRMGIKPFYYYWDGQLFAFASEIKALLAHPAISGRLDESLLAEYLSFGYISEERTMFAGIRKLMPGHRMTIDCRGQAPRLNTEQYWEIPTSVAAERHDERAWIEELSRRLEETVRMRLMSDVPLGMFLSGGVDSSLIAALMKRMVSSPVLTFSVGYQETEFSELGYARQVSDSIGTQHHEVRVSMPEFFNCLPSLVWHEDEPITWPSSVPLYFVSRLASKHVKVVLTGEGSDELFAGYGRYRFFMLNDRWARPYRLVPAPLRRRIRSFIGNSTLLSGTLRRKLKHTFLGCGEGLESLYLDNFYSALSGPELRSLVPSSNAAGAAGANFLRYWNDARTLSPLGRLLFADQKTYLVELLMKQDQMSMAASIESRVPLLDHLLVEFAAGVPDSLKLRGSEGKYIVKKAAEAWVPREILYRKKMGFPTPLRAWLASEKAAPVFAMLERKGGLLDAYVDRRRLTELLDRHRNGKEDATDRIWRLLNLEIWGDVFFSGRRPEVRDEPPLIV